MSEWDRCNPRLWVTCRTHGTYDAQDGACPGCVREAEREDANETVDHDQEYRQCDSAALRRRSEDRE